MTNIHRIVSPGRTAGTILSETGEQVSPPEDWAFLPSGDAAITKSVKAKGPTWVVQVRKGRRNISKGIWAKKEDILSCQKEVEAKRATPEYHKRRQRDRARRAVKQAAYADTFNIEVISFLAFHPQYQKEAHIIADKVTAHATPIGSGTVARTERIPIKERAKAAVIAWMRHQTTSYDSMRIERIKGRRREIRRKLAAESIKILGPYRTGRPIDPDCPLKKVLLNSNPN